MPHPFNNEPCGESDVRLDRETLTAAVAIALLPVWRGIALWTPSVVDLAPDERVLLHLVDLPLAVLVVLTVLRLRRAPGSVSPAAKLPVTTFVLLIAWSFTATAHNPSWLAIQWYFHVAAATALALCIARSRGPVRAVILTTICGFAASQAVLGVAQSLVGRRIGLGPVEAVPVRWVGGELAAIGSYLHSYRLATVLLLGLTAGYVLWYATAGRLRSVAALTIAASGFALPLTYSRASLLALCPMVLLGLLSQRLDKRPTIYLVAVLLLGGILSTSGWMAKTERSLDADSYSSGRVTIADEALSVIADHPLLGVGTGRYVVDRASDVAAYRPPPHNALLHLGGELGVPGLLLGGAAIATASWWARTGGRLTMLAAVALLPLFLLDWFPYAHPRGIPIAGLWWGCVVLARRVDFEIGAPEPRHAADAPTLGPRPDDQVVAGQRRSVK